MPRQLQVFKVAPGRYRVFDTVSGESLGGMFPSYAQAEEHLFDIHGEYYSEELSDKLRQEYGARNLAEIMVARADLSSKTDHDRAGRSPDGPKISGPKSKTPTRRS